MKDAISMSALVAAVAPLLCTPPLSGDEPASIATDAEVHCSATADVRVILVAIDGVRWQEVYEGTDPALVGDRPRRSAQALVPHLHALAKRGIALGAPGHGEAFYASGPNFVSLPGYTEMLTGRPAPCQENDCTDRPNWTLLDAFHSTGSSVGAIASWAPIARVAAADPEVGLISAGRVPSDRVRALPTMQATFDAGARAGASPGHGDYRPDAFTRAIALGVLQRERPRFLFVGLGDTDEHAHAGDYGAYLDALGLADRFVGDVMELASAWRKEGEETIVVVTTDHGRSADFRNHGRAWAESGRGWLIAAGGPIPARGFVSSPRPRHLKDIAPTLAAVAKLPIERRGDSGEVITEMLTSCEVR